MNVGCLTTRQYRANAASEGIRQSELAEELFQRTSSQHTNKLLQSNYGGVPLHRTENIESFLDFYNDLLSLGTEDEDDQATPYALEVVFVITGMAFPFLGT